MKLRLRPLFQRWVLQIVARLPDTAIQYTSVMGKKHYFSVTVGCFVFSPLHRFKRPGSKNFQNIHGPSSTLHLSNIPPTCSEEQLVQAFKDAEFDVKAFKFFPNDHRMALIQLSSVEEAILALIKMHNHQLGQSHHLRVSFSKSTIN